jgi:hypothetical protein
MNCCVLGLSNNTSGHILISFVQIRYKNDTESEKKKNHQELKVRNTCGGKL